MNYQYFSHGLKRFQANFSMLGTFSVRTIGIFLFVLMLNLCLKAQFEPPTNSYLQKSPLVEFCDQVNFNSVVPLKVNGAYRIYAQVGEDNSFFPEDIWLEDVEGKTFELTLHKSSNAFISQVIPEGKTVMLKYIDGCSKIVEDRTSSTEYNVGQIITVSNKMFALVADISAKEKRRYNDILESVVASKSIDDFEKLSFVQQYLLKGESLASTKLEGISNLPSFNKMKDDCNCTVISTYFTNTPGTHLQPIEGQLSSRTITTDHTVTQSNELELNLRSSGPAKLWHVYSDGWKRTNGTWYGGATGAQVGTGSDGVPMIDPIVDSYLNDGISLPSEFVQNTSIRMLLFCNDGVQTEECGCAKQIQPTAMYESEIGVRTQVLEGGGGTKRALAFGEDAAILYRQVITGPNAGEFELMGGDIFQVGSECNSEVNPRFFSSILDVFGAAAQIALGFTGLTPDSTANIRTQVDEFLSAIDTVANTQRRFVSGDCAAFDEERRFEFTIRPFYLRPSEVTQFALASRSRALSMGMRSWQSEVLIKSDYRLAIYQPRGTNAIRTDDEEEKIQCCTERASVAWIYGVIGLQSDVPTVNMNLDSDPISSAFDLRASLGEGLGVQSGEVTLFPLELGRRVVPYQWGQLVGSLGNKEGCQVELEEDQNPQGPIGESLEPGKMFNLRSSNIGDQPTLGCTYMVYTIDGKSIGKVTGTLMLDESGEKTINHSLINGWLQRKNLPAGIYLVSSVDQNGHLLLPTKKVIVTK